MPDPLSRALAERLFAADTALPEVARLAITAVAAYGLVLVGLVLLASAWAEADRWTLRARFMDTAWILAPALVSAALALALANVLGLLLPVDRPFVVLDKAPLFPYGTDASFPSDHVAVGAAFLAAPLHARGGKTWMLLLSLAVGACRIAAGVHWLADVLAAVALGLAVAFVVRRIWIAVVQRPGREPILTR